MRHVEKSTSGISLHSHILGFRQPRQRAQSARPCNLRLVVLVRGQVGDTADSIALDLDVWRHHLFDQGLQPAELDDQDLVLG
jgi:hypothetical protein